MPGPASFKLYRPVPVPPWWKWRAGGTCDTGCRGWGGRGSRASLASTSPPTAQQGSAAGSQCTSASWTFWPEAKVHLLFQLCCLVFKNVGSCLWFCTLYNCRRRENVHVDDKKDSDVNFWHGNSWWVHRSGTAHSWRQISLRQKRWRASQMSKAPVNAHCTFLTYPTSGWCLTGVKRSRILSQNWMPFSDATPM